MRPIRKLRTSTKGLIVLKKILARLLLLSAMVCAGATMAASVDVNQATEAELDSIKGVGPALSGKIMVERQKAPFKDWTDFINRTKGMGPSAAKRFSEQGMTVGGTAYTDAAGEASNKSTNKKTQATPAKSAQPTHPPAQ